MFFVKHNVSFRLAAACFIKLKVSVLSKKISLLRDEFQISRNYRISRKNSLTYQL